MLMRYENVKQGRTTLTKVQTTFHEFVELSNAEGNRHTSSDSSSTGGFYGDIGSYKEMYDACYSGLNAAKMLEVKANLGALMNHEVEEPRKALVGETMNVAAFAAGHPYHYMKDSDEFGKPRVHLVYSTNAVAGVRADEFIRHGAAVCALVAEIAEQVDVKISLYITNVYVLAGNGCQVVTIKDYDEVTDVPRVAATAHPSFFRRIGFSWFENAKRLISEECDQGCGGSSTGKDRERVISDDDFKEWVGAASDEMLVDFPAPDEHQFGNDSATAEWLKVAADAVTEGIDKNTNHVKLYDLL
jgi:hypothetical protein